MSFNYRIFKEIENTSDASLTQEEINASQRVIEEVYTIRLVGYNKEGTPINYGEPYWPIGNTKNQLLGDIMFMQDAFSKPILTIEDFK